MKKATIATWLCSFLGSCVGRFSSVLLPLIYATNHLAAWLHWLELYFRQFICPRNFNIFDKWAQVIDLCLRLSLFPPILWEFVPNQILSLIFSSGSLMKGQPLASSFKSVTNCSIVSALPWTGVVKIISGKHWVRFWFKVASNRSKKVFSFFLSSSLIRPCLNDISALFASPYDQMAALFLLFFAR